MNLRNKLFRPGRTLRFARGGWRDFFIAPSGGEGSSPLPLMEGLLIVCANNLSLPHLAFKSHTTQHKKQGISKARGGGIYMSLWNETRLIPEHRRKLAHLLLKDIKLLYSNPTFPTYAAWTRLYSVPPSVVHSSGT